MSFRTTAILFGIVFVLGVALLILSLSEEETATTKEPLLSNLAGAKAEEIDTVEIEKGSARLVLKRKDKDHWSIVEPITARADGGVERIIESLLKLRATSYPELSANPAVHGLDTPGLRVTLRAGDKSDTLNIGDVTIGGSKAVAFVTTPERKRPMAVPRGDIEPLLKENRAGVAGDLAKWTNDYRTKQVFALDPRTGADDVTAIKLTARGKDLALTRAAGGAWQFTSPAGWGDAAATGEPSTTNASAITGVRGLLNTVVNLQASTADDFIDHPKDLKEYGLNPEDPDRLRVELKEKGGATEVAYIGKKQEAAPPAAPGSPAPPAPPAKVYVKLEGSNTVVHVAPPATLDGLYADIANPDPLRDRDLVKEADKSRIDAIDITVAGKTTKLRKVGGSFGSWELFGGPNDPQKADPDAIRKLIDLLTKSHVVKDFPPPSDANFTPAETRSEIKLWTDAIKPSTDPKADPKAEPKVEGPPIVLQFGKKDAEGIYVRRTQANGTKNDCRVPEKVKIGGATPPPQPFSPAPPPPSAGEEVDVAAIVAETRLDFLDRSLKGFSSLQANKLTIQKGANITEIALDKTPKPPSFPNGTWKYVKPDSLKDRIADSGTASDLLTALATESVVRIVAEAPGDAELTKWGLDPKNPKLKATVGLDTGPAPDKEKEKEKEKERIYYFGNETDDKQHVYARQEGKTAVFTVPKLTSEKLATADLRDKTVVRFDRAKLKKVSLRGFKEKAGFESELVFERKGGAWAVAKAPGKYDLDPTKLDRFLDGVNNLRAKAFLPGPPKPEYKLVPEAGGLEVKLELDGAPSIVLFVGAATDSDASYFAQTSALPANENIFTVLSDVFKPYKDNSGSFAK
jgi:hypothetical protein